MSQFRDHLIEQMTQTWARDKDGRVVFAKYGPLVTRAFIAWFNGMEYNGARTSKRN